LICDFVASSIKKRGAVYNASALFVHLPEKQEKSVLIELADSLERSRLSRRNSLDRLGHQLACSKL
jgi:hypothetical protein